MESVLQPPLPFKFENSLVNVTSGNLCKEWKKWKSAFLIYYEACEISKKDAKVQLNIFLHIIGDKGRELYDQFKGESRTLEDVLKKFDDFFLPKKNLTVERHKFFTRDQLEFESIEQYAYELSRMARSCGFKDLCDDLVRDRLICGIHEASLRERLLRETDLTLQKAIEICRLAEISRVQASHIKQENIEHHVHEISSRSVNTTNQQCTSMCQCAQVKDDTKEQSVHAVSTSSASADRRRRSPWRGGYRGRAVTSAGHPRAAPARNDAKHHDMQTTSGRWQRQSPRTRPGHRCWRCGSSHRRFQCPAFGQQCDRCSGKNHYSKMCRVYEVKGESTDEVFVCSGVWSNNFLYGLSVGTPTVAIPQLKKEANSTEAVTEEMASWISSGSGISGLVWLILISILASKVGRRRSFIIISFNSLVGFAVLYFSKNALHLLIGIVMHGAPRSGMYILSPIIVTEYSSPCHRGLFSTLDSASFFWGIWIANTIGTFAQWKNIAIIGILCSLYAMISISWPESPQWLASKGKFDQCTAAHRWLKGSSSRSEDELGALISSQTHEREEAVRLKRETLLCQISKIIRESKFYKPFLTSCLMTLLSVFSGKAMSTIYSLVMIKRITNSTDVAYTGMLILDGLTVFCAYIGCGLAKCIKRRTLLFTASSISILFMLMISLHLYLIKLDIISENTTLSLLLLSGYSLSLSCGPAILTTAIISELLPLKYRSLMYLIVSLMGQLPITILLKMSLLIFRVLGMHGTFLLMYALPSLVILSLLYRYLPETKDKTLQEIEKYFKDN